MGMSSGGRNSRYVSEINVTPMVDVMLVLLIIFMIGAPMLEQGVDVELPKTKKAKSIRMDSKPIVLTLDHQGNLFAGNQKLPSLEKYLSKLDKERQILLKAHKAIAYGEVVQVMATIRSEGFTKLGLVTKDN